MRNAALFLLTILSLAACGRAAATTPGTEGSPTAQPAAPAATSTSPSPAAEGISTAGLPAFACAPASGGGNARANVTSARASTASGFDRFVLEFDGAVPAYTVKPTPTATFTQDPSGQQLKLAGAAGLRITLVGSTLSPKFGDPADVTYPHPVLKESRRLGDFEGTLSWGLGLARPSCFRVFVLTVPGRLVIDLEAG